MSLVVGVMYFQWFAGARGFLHAAVELLVAGYLLSHHLQTLRTLGSRCGPGGGLPYITRVRVKTICTEKGMALNNITFFTLLKSCKHNRILPTHTLLLVVVVAFHLNLQLGNH